MNLKKWAALLLTVTALCIHTPARAECAPHKEAVSALMQNGYGWLSTAITKEHIVLQVFVNRNTGEWVIIAIDDDLNTCVLIGGYGWAFVMENAI